MPSVYAPICCSLQWAEICLLLTNTAVKTFYLFSAKLFRIQFPLCVTTSNFSLWQRLSSLFFSSWAYSGSPRVVLFWRSSDFPVPLLMCGLKSWVQRCSSKHHRHQWIIRACWTKGMFKLWYILMTSCYTIWKPGFTEVSNYGKCPNFMKTLDSWYLVGIIFIVMKVCVKCMYVSIRERVKFIKMEMVGLWWVFIFCALFSIFL